MLLTKIVAPPLLGAPPLGAIAKHTIAKHGIAFDSRQVPVHMVSDADGILKEIRKSYQEEYAMLMGLAWKDASDKYMHDMKLFWGDKPAEFYMVQLRAFQHSRSITDAIEIQIGSTLMKRYFGQNSDAVLKRLMIVEKQAYEANLARNNPVQLSLLRLGAVVDDSLQEKMYAKHALMQLGKGKYNPAYVDDLFKELGGAQAVWASMQPIRFDEVNCTDTFLQETQLNLVPVNA